MFSGQLKCQECDQEFTLNQNLIRHVKTVHGKKARKDNEARKEVMQVLEVSTRWRSSQVPIWANLRSLVLEVCTRWHLNHQLIMCHWL